MTEPPSGRVAVVVVNYGSHALIAANLGAMPEAASVFIVDNFMSDLERDSVANLCTARGWELVALADNRGFGAGCNAGMRAAQERGCECFLLLNPDAVLSSDVIDQLRQQVLRQPLTLVSPCLDDSNGRRVYQGVELLLRNGRMKRAETVGAGFGPARPDRWPWLSGAALALHAEVFARTGGLDESYFLYWEDVDFSVRATAAGCALAVRTDLIGVHDEGGTHSTSHHDRAKSSIYYYHNCRNRLYFAARHLSRRQVVRWLLATPGASWEILMRGGRRQLLHSPSLGLAALRGTVAGVIVALASLARPGCDA